MDVLHTETEHYIKFVQFFCLLHSLTTLNVLAIWASASFGTVRKPSYACSLGI